MKQLEEKDAKGPNVNLIAMWLVFKDFGRHVLIGPAKRPSFGIAGNRPAEIAKLRLEFKIHVSASAHKDVLWLDVPVNDVVHVKVADSTANLFKHDDPLLLGQALMLLQETEEIPVLSEFKYDVHLVFALMTIR